MLRNDRALIPGSYDPVTRGHIDVIRRSAALFQKIWVAVVRNPEKAACFSAEERLELLRTELARDESIEVIAFDGLVVDLAAELGARWIVRGLRSAEDAGYELPMAHSNRVCGREEIETIFVPTSAGLAFISSRLVRQIAAEGGVLAPFVTPLVEKALRDRFPAEKRPPKGAGPASANAAEHG